MRAQTGSNQFVPLGQLRLGRQ